MSKEVNSFEPVRMLERKVSRQDLHNEEDLQDIHIQVVSKERTPRKSRLTTVDFVVLLITGLFACLILAFISTAIYMWFS